MRIGYMGFPLRLINWLCMGNTYLRCLRWLAYKPLSHLIMQTLGSNLIWPKWWILELLKRLEIFLGRGRTSSLGANICLYRIRILRNDMCWYNNLRIRKRLRYTINMHLRLWNIRWHMWLVDLLRIVICHIARHHRLWLTWCIMSVNASNFRGSFNPQDLRTNIFLLSLRARMGIHNL